MNWGGVNGFFAMGGYGLFVWGSYGMMLLAVVIELLTLAARRDSERVRR